MPIAADSLQSAIAALSDALFAAESRAPGTDWNCREDVAYGSVVAALDCTSWATPDRMQLFLGGDALRPYATLELENHILVVSRKTRDLSLPRLIGELASGQHRVSLEVDVATGHAPYLAQVLAPGDHGAQVARLPNVQIVSLTDATRYQSRRYPLNIARLAQWLRFQHAARVTPMDLPLGFKGDIGRLCEHVISSSPDILGVSLNFGEIEALRALVTALRTAELFPMLSVGNVLAAWADEEVRAICRGFDLSISYSYGEADLEALCRAFPDGFRASTSDSSGAPRTPTSIVVPDERLLAATLGEGGQASLETSFGCQYGRCTFCPRDHRSPGWRRPAPSEAAAVTTVFASIADEVSPLARNVVSLVDEDAFGQEGISTAGGEEPSIVRIVETAAAYGLSCEIYTRIEQIFDRRREAEASRRRFRQLLRMRPALQRVFVGVESGSDSQLRRYGKGQTTSDVVDALRMGSLLALPLEFGFITFDPLLTQPELAENLDFFARSDVLLQPPQGVVDPDSLLELLEDGPALEARAGTPIYSRVAYMATELEVFGNSAFLRLLQRAAPQLVGDFNCAFARHDCSYLDPGIGAVAGWCRVWTEGTFEEIYRARLALRTADEGSQQSRMLVENHRRATFGLLVALAARFCPEISGHAQQLLALHCKDLPLKTTSQPDISELRDLWRWIGDTSGADVSDDIDFRVSDLENRRDS